MCCVGLVVAALVVASVIAVNARPASTLLQASWWQGIAGIAQILAAVFAVVTIVQARRTIKQADEERRLSVAPDWDLLDAGEAVARTPESVGLFARFANTGLGPARNIEVSFQSKNGNEFLGVEWAGTLFYHERKNWLHLPEMLTLGKVIRSGELLDVELFWEGGLSLDGVLSIESATRFGNRVRHQFHVAARMGVDDTVEVDMRPLSELA